ncbi:MAG: glycosyl hydrolase family protein [Actinobacteria bacterium]|nr:glycosyl hydrolase family protein [Actinomycetota bacterium]
MMSFPDGFLWGTATAAHQVEGGNSNNDWWAWEHADHTRCEEPSGDACDQYWRYPEDLDILVELGFGAYRFSLEWSRIQPEPNEWSTAQLDHYSRMLDACHERGLMPVVTFHHFTNPRWMAADGGWANPVNADRFADFCAHAVGVLGDRIGMACTINEPNILPLMGWLWGLFPPGIEQDLDGYQKATHTLIDAHAKAAAAIKAGPGDFPVGLTVSMNDWIAMPGAEEQLEQYRHAHEDVYLETCRGDDFLGVQAYTRGRVDEKGMMGHEDGVEVLPMGYEYWPNAAAGALRHAIDVTGIPVYVTENGIGTDDDEQRIRFLRDSLTQVAACIDEGLDVRGFFHWSLLDNFEWAFGYRMRFGIVAVDRTTQVRTIKPSARWLSEVVNTNRIA